MKVHSHRPKDEAKAKAKRKKPKGKRTKGSGTKVISTKVAPVMRNVRSNGNCRKAKYQSKTKCMETGKRKCGSQSGTDERKGSGGHRKEPLLGKSWKKGTEETEG